MKNFLAKTWDIIKSFFYKYRFIFARIGISLITLALAMVLCFVLLQLMPADSIEQMAIKLVAENRISLEEARIRAVQILGYDPDEPLLNKIGRYLGNLFHGNLGTSIVNPSITVNDAIKRTLPWTLFIATISLIVSFVLGTLLGSFMAWRRGKLGDNVATGYIIVSSSMPDYILGLLVLLIFAYKLQWFPTMGAYSINTDVGFNIAFICSCLYHAALPIFANVFISTAGWALLMRGSSIAVMGEDYIWAARARGIPEKAIISKFLRRNALLPLIASLALSFAALFGGSPLMESIFNYPGLGQEFSKYVSQRDYFMIIGILFFQSFIIIIANLIADSLYSIIDPRIRRSA